MFLQLKHMVKTSLLKLLYFNIISSKKVSYKVLISHITNKYTSHWIKELYFIKKLEKDIKYNSSYISYRITQKR